MLQNHIYTSSCKIIYHKNELILNVPLVHISALIVSQEAKRKEKIMSKPTKEVRKTINAA